MDYQAFCKLFMIKFTNNQKKIIEYYIGNSDYFELINVYPKRYQFLEYKIPSLVDSNLPFVCQLKLISGFKRFYFNNSYGISFVVNDVNNNVFNCVMYGVKFFPKININSVFNCICTLNDKKLNITNLSTTKSIDELIGIFPIYPLKNKIKQYQIRALMNKVINNYNVKDNLPIEIINHWKLLDYNQAIRQIHLPTSKKTLNNAIRTIKYRECLNFIVNIIYKQVQINQQMNHQLKFDCLLKEKIINSLNFQLTNDQIEVLNNTINLCSNNDAVNSIICGDVGCGKTIIALILMLSLFKEQQVILIAPTEILAIQHFNNIKKLTDENVVLLTSNTKNVELLSQIKNNTSNIIIATHAAFSKDVEFNNLCLVIFDEQQRFGVNQRTELINKMNKKNILMLTATPIPRSLAGALANYCSIQFINQYPNEHKKIHSSVIYKLNFNKLVAEIKKLILNKQQIYIVCSSIYDEISGVLAVYQKLATNYNFKVGFIHSQLNPDVISQTISDFSQHNFDILVSTTIIEVGIDIKNANGMFIIDADCFGLSQLHQLRGRVGRGNYPGFCYFITDNQESISKLNFLANENDGFQISLYDLKMRGSGDWLGVEQSGYLPFVYFDPINDSAMVKCAISDAHKLINFEYNNSENYINDIINDNKYYF